MIPFIKSSRKCKINGQKIVFYWGTDKMGGEVWEKGITQETMKVMDMCSILLQ